MGDYDYVKVLLYAYPKLDMLAEAIASGAETKAFLSFRATDTLNCAEKISQGILQSRILRKLANDMEDAFSRLSEEERYLLEYKYFRRKSELCGRFAETSFSGSEREYFRRQNALLKKVACLLIARGVTEETFFRDLGDIPPFPRVYRAVREGRERMVIPKRKTQEIRFQNSGSCGAVFLPRRTNTAMTTTAAIARDATIICKAETFAVSSGSGTGSETTTV